MIKISKDGTTAVDTETKFRKDWENCPKYVKLQLLTEGRTAVYGIYNGDHSGYIGFAGVPTVED